MKKLIGIGCCLFLFTSCVSTSNKKEFKELETTDKEPKGLKLINTYDCLACHKIDEKLTGPSYQEIAAKYPNTKENVDYLSTKIIKGGQGVWGAMVMLPHSQVNEEDAKEMASYILGLHK